MGLKTSLIHRNLDNKFKIVGLEAHDLLFVLMLGSIMNILFGHTTIGLFFSLGLPFLLALVLFYVKRDKPEKYLLHLIKFHFSPGHYSSGVEAKNENKLKAKIYEKH
jgi:hypothetical protein